MTAQAIFILGMHRSGTSALARVLNLLGVELSSNMMPAADDNEKGFWEHAEAVRIHDILLRQLGHSWEDGTPLPQDWLQHPAIAEARKEIAALIDQDFSNSKLWGIKDPRLSLLFPLWEPLLAERNIKPLCILTWRHPQEVAASLARRDSIPEESALLCWLAYTLESWQACTRYPSAILRYDDLLTNWQGTVNSLAEQLNIEWPVAEEDAAAEIEAFLEPSLRHHKKSALPNGPQTLHHLIRDCVEALEHNDQWKFQSLYAIWQDFCFATAPLLRRVRLELEEQRQQAETLKQQAADIQHRAHDLEGQMELLRAHTAKELEAIQEENEKLRQAYEAIVASTSWKLTSPLRGVKSALVKKESA